MNNIIKTWLVVGLMAATVDAADKPKAPEKTVISAENFMFNPLKNIAVYEGDVVVIDAQMDLLSDKLTIHFADKDKAPKNKPVAPPAKKSGVDADPQKAASRQSLQWLDWGGTLIVLWPKGMWRSLTRKIKPGL